ncbi:serine carboxypeptidase [Salix suchowensis]|nr:serine carboxypeptidase [Salix suchowensis]
MDSKKMSLVLILSFLFIATISPFAFSMREIPLTSDGGADEITTASNTRSNIPLSNVMLPVSSGRCLPPGTSPCMIGDVSCCSGICLLIYPPVCG